MAFPTNNIPKFRTTHPVTNKDVVFRPFLVGEQKNLLMAMGGNEQDILLAMKSAVDACTFNKLDMDNLPNFVLEFLFLQIRAKSIGESIDLILTCGTCGVKDEHQVRLADVQVQKTEGHSTKILLADNLGVTMRYPTTEQLSFLNENYTTEVVFDTLLDCIESVFTADEVTQTKDEPREALLEFVESLTTQQMTMIEDFFRTMPKLKHEFAHKCSHCGNDTTFTMEGIESFFH